MEIIPLSNGDLWFRFFDEEIEWNYNLTSFVFEFNFGINNRKMGRIYRKAYRSLDMGAKKEGKKGHILFSLIAHDIFDYAVGRGLNSLLTKIGEYVEKELGIRDWSINSTNNVMQLCFNIPLKWNREGRS